MSRESEDAQHAAAKTAAHNAILLSRELLAKFKTFFAGLIFAMLSFIGTHPIITKIFYLKILETLSLGFLFIAGIILLLHLAGYKVNESQLKEKSYGIIMQVIFLREKPYWICFILGMLLLLTSRSIFLFKAS